MRPLILASTSPRRRELIRELGLPHVAHSVDVLELTQETAPALAPGELALVNAMRKAAAVAALPEHAEGRQVVLGADTIVVLEGRILGKPRDLTEAAHFLQMLGGKTHAVMSAVALHVPEPPRLPPGAGRARFLTLVETTAVTFRPLSQEVIAEYLREVPVLDKAGAYALQQRADLILDRIEGSASNVIGLPMEGLRGLLVDAGLL
ncbi:septum formation protein Maf [Verrucomicrobia bacterium LW23]|nr:septum formation protein Maf [Verrucomicrobia bacterium LW23]